MNPARETECLNLVGLSELTTVGDDAQLAKFGEAVEYGAGVTIESNLRFVGTIDLQDFFDRDVEMKRRDE